MAKRKILINPSPKRSDGQRKNSTNPRQVEYSSCSCRSCRDTQQEEYATEVLPRDTASYNPNDINAVTRGVIDCVTNRLKNKLSDDMIGVFGLYHDEVIENTLYNIGNRNDAIILQQFTYKSDLLGNFCASMFDFIANSDFFRGYRYDAQRRMILTELDKIYSTIRSAKMESEYESALRRLSVLSSYQNRHEEIKKVFGLMAQLFQNQAKFVMAIDIGQNLNYATLSELYQILNRHLVLIIHSDVRVDMIRDSGYGDAFSMASPYSDRLSKFLYPNSIFTVK